MERALELLAGTNTPASPEDAARWKDAKLADLAAYIVEQHHAFVRREAPRLEALTGKVAEKHGERNPELSSIRDLFAAIAQEFFAHMMKEENLLFPYLSQMESAVLAGEPVPPPFFGSVQNPIARMLAEHDDAGELLAQIRKLAGGFHPPDDACPSYRALYHGLEEFERDLHRHIHLENNILFPRAVNLERECARGARDDSSNAVMHSSRSDFVTREVSLQRLLTAYILAGLLFMLLPGTFLGVWNLLSISSTHTVASLSPAWLQAHGHAQIFGWIGTFILGIGFYSLSKMGNLPPFAVSRGWICFAIWTAGVLLRWTVNITAWQWRVALPASAALELAAFLIFFRTVSRHRPEPATGVAHRAPSSHGCWWWSALLLAF